MLGEEKLDMTQRFAYKKMVRNRLDLSSGGDLGQHDNAALDHLAFPGVSQFGFRVRREVIQAYEDEMGIPGLDSGSVG
jgi:hypothetical protein